MRNYDAMAAQLDAPPPETYRAMRLCALSIEPRAVVVQQMVEAGAVVAIAGVPGAGKSALAVDLALHVAAGAPWFGKKVAAGAVLYVAAEAPGSIAMRARAAAARKFPGEDLPLYVVSSGPLIGDDRHTDADGARLIATIQQVAAEAGATVRLVVIDTLASCLGSGDENSDGMIRIVHAAERIALETGATVALIHHPSKGDAAGLRGHGSLLGKADTVITIEVDATSGARVATLMKSRDYATGVRIAYELDVLDLGEPDQFGDPRTTIMVRPVDAPVKVRRPSGRSQEALLAELERRHRTGETGWDLATVRQAAKSLGIRSNIERTVTGLRTGGFVRGGDAHMTLSYPPDDGPDVDGSIEAITRAAVARGVLQ